MPSIPNAKLQLPNSELAKLSAKPLFLIGMPGAGKTYWGRQIAKAYNREFIDLDVFISLHEKESIPAMFASYGENGFREKERNCLTTVINTTAGHNTIVACGGGTPLYQDNMRLMMDAGTVIYLAADVPVLLRNLAASPEIRPLLKGEDGLPELLEKMCMVRKSIYEQAHHILHTELISITTFEEIIR